MKRMKKITRKISGKVIKHELKHEQEEINIIKKTQRKLKIYLLNHKSHIAVDWMPS